MSSYIHGQFLKKAIRKYILQNTYNSFNVNILF